MGESFLGPWLLVGNFNAMLSSKDKFMGKPISSFSTGGFKGMVDQNG